MATGPDQCQSPPHNDSATKDHPHRDLRGQAWETINRNKKVSASSSFSRWEAGSQACRYLFQSHDLIFCLLAQCSDHEIALGGKLPITVKQQIDGVKATFAF